MDNQRRIVVIGGGPAAHRFAEAMGERNLPGTTVTVLSEEQHTPYDRVALSKAFIDPLAELTLTDSVWHNDAVTLRTGARVVGLDTATQHVILATGENLPYDELVLATGSNAATLPIPGAQHSLVYRTLDDVWELNRLITQHAATGTPPRVVTIGGGLLGLEAAAGAIALGADAHVIDGGRWLMSHQLDQGAGQALGRLIDSCGITVHSGVYPAQVLTSPAEESSDVADTVAATVTGVRMADDRDIPADIVITAIGVRPRDELARNANERAGTEVFALGQRGGVMIDASCATSVPHVWAIGEVACFDGRCVGLVAPANAMAEIVADRLSGGQAAFDGFDTATKLKLSGVDVASFGDAFATTPGALEVVYADPARGVYQKIVVSGDTTTLLGGVFVGDAEPYTALRPLLGRELPAEPGAYLTAAGGADLPDSDLPDDAILCSCNNVTAGAIRDAIGGCGTCEGQNPVHELAPLKACTKAGTQCGSCVPMLKKLLETELVNAGVEVSQAMCEHIDMSRAQLFEAVQLTGLVTWQEIMARFGTGAGCDICKPAIASILSTLTHTHPLDNGLGGFQDTNDRALANMQKDGTYSVVPRIPGGEITPDKLAVIASVAKKYDLYTKLTGGLRIDMFGARLDQLPEIWRELVDAGFESGQAYGKSLRNVKTCVGSSWCRYGMLDSVGMGIGIELRYRGLRAPHKFKMGVSGCARECAEARGKDVGVIATANGWNLYVAGNGGATPAHAQLLAKEVDDETLIRYIDRFLMYYIRTADRLQRTARWLEELDGGIDRVIDVVVNDCLGIGDDLEAAMAEHVDNYEDEWAATLKDPERLRRFSSFVNTPAPDPTLAYDEERGQRRPHAPVSLGATIPTGAPEHSIGQEVTP